jgi:hypothetical protein
VGVQRHLVRDGHRLVELAGEYERVRGLQQELGVGELRFSGQLHPSLGGPGTRGVVFDRLVVLGELEPRDDGDLLVLELRRLAQEAFGLLGLPPGPQPLRQRRAEAARGRRRLQGSAQDLQRAIELPLGVMEPHRFVDYARIGGESLDAVGPALPGQLELPALVGKNRHGGAVPGLAVRSELCGFDPIPQRLDCLCGLVDPIEIEQGEDSRLQHVGVLRVQLENAVDVDERLLLALLRGGDRVRVGPQQQGGHVLGIFFENARRGGDRRCVVAHAQRIGGELLPRLGEPLRIVHRLAQRPLGQTRLPQEAERPTVEVVELRVFGSLGEQLPQRLQRPLEVSGGVLLPDSGQRIRRLATGEPDEHEQEQSGEGGAQRRRDEGITHPPNIPTVSALHTEVWTVHTDAEALR